MTVNLKTKWGRFLSERLGLYVLTVLFLIEQIRILFDFAIHYTDIDQTLLWYAAKEFVHGRLHEPNFYGQLYNTIFESVPGYLLHLLGVPLNISISLSSMVIVTIIWVALAWVIFYKGHKTIALIALSIPIVLRIQYLILYDAPRGILAGDFLAVLAGIIVLWFCKNSILKIAILVSLGGLAIEWDYPAAFIVVPVFVYIICEEWPQILKNIKKTWTIAAALLVPLVWLYLQKTWYTNHPYDLTAPSVSIIPKYSIFLNNISHFSSYVAFFAPALTPESFMATVLICIFIVTITLIVIKRKSYSLLLSICSLVLLVLLALSIPRASNYLNDFYLSAPRLLLTLPVGIYFLLAMFGMDTQKHQEATKLIAKQGKIIIYLSWVIVVFSFLTFIIVQYKFNDIIDRAMEPDIKSQMLINPNALLASCKTINEVYVSTHAQLFAINNGNVAYGCAAQYNDLNTIEPVYDRRGWIINESYTHPITRILIQGSSCNIVLVKYLKCYIEKYNNLLIISRPTPPALTLAQLGLPVKDYTPPTN